MSSHSSKKKCLICETLGSHSKSKIVKVFSDFIIDCLNDHFNKNFVNGNFACDRCIQVASYNNRKTKKIDKKNQNMNKNLKTNESIGVNNNEGFFFNCKNA